MKLKNLISATVAAVVMLSGFSAMNGFQLDLDAVAVKNRVSVHDPSIFKDSNGTYYVFGSHIDAAKSNDLQSWTRFTNGYARDNNVLFGTLSLNLSGAFAWAGEDLEDCAGGFSVWAPDVIYNPDYINTNGTKGAYMMYFCTSSTYMRSVIAYAVSQKPEGPYTYVDTLIYSGFTSNDSYATSTTKNVNRKYTSTNIDELIASGKVTYNDQWFRGTGFNNQTFPNAIDPTIYYEPDGTMYMCYGSWSGGIFTLEMDPATGKCIHPKTGTTGDGRLVDSYFGTKISGGNGKSGEGPFIEYNSDNGYYYLWVTYGGLTAQGGYNMRVFRSTSPTGPFVDAAGRQAVLGSGTSLDSIGLKVMGNYKFSSLSTAYMACGHNSVLCDDDGRWYLINHARFNTGNEFHEVRVHSMYFNSEGWPVVAPYEYSGDVISDGGYNINDIVGDYEFINHGSDTGSQIHEFSNITLNADGTISGSSSGTWSQANDSAAAVIVIGGQTYHGVFLAAQDETAKEKKVMSFTAVGSNNQTIWGAKTSAYTGTERASLVDYTNNSASLVYAPETAGIPDGAVRLCDTELLSGVPYSITNKNSGMELDLADGSINPGTNIQQWTKANGSRSEWRLVALDNGYCKIVSMSDESKCISVAESSAENGVNIQLSVYDGGDEQLWKLVPNGIYYGIVSKCSADAAGLDVYDWSVENGGNIAQWEYWGGDCQLWQIAPTHATVNNGAYSIRSVNNSTWLSADTNGNASLLSDTTNWTFTKLSDGSYSIVNDSNLALTVDGDRVTLLTFTDASSQKFMVNCNKDGSYSFLPVASDRKSCIDAANASLRQTNFLGEDSQKFVIEPSAQVGDSLLGDVNLDGTVDIRDVAMLAKRAVGVLTLSSESEANADINGDGLIDIRDVAMLAKAASGIITL